MHNLWRHLLHDEAGSTAVEYCLLAGGIALAIIVAVLALGDAIIAAFATLSNFFSTAGR